MQYASRSSAGRNTLVAQQRPASAEHARVARLFWLRAARRALGVARWWLSKFGGPLHDIALGWHLEALLDADLYRTWAHELGGTP